MVSSAGARRYGVIAGLGLGVLSTCIHIFYFTYGLSMWRSILFGSLISVGDFLFLTFLFRFRKEATSQAFIKWHRVAVSLIVSLFIIVQLLLSFYYRYPSFHADDWKVAYRYFESQGGINAIFEKHNGHNAWLPNALATINFKVFSGQTIFQVTINWIFLFLLELIFVRVMYSSLLRYTSKLNAFIWTCSIAVVLTWMPNSVLMFWSIEFMPLFFIVASCYSLSKMNGANNKKMLCWVMIFSILATISHGAGALLWVLLLIWLYVFGFKKYDRKTLISFSLIAVVITFVFAYSNQHLINFDMLRHIHIAIPAFIGGPLVTYLLHYFPLESLVLPSTVIGCLFTLIICLLLTSLYKIKSQYDYTVLLRFAILQIIFVLIFGVVLLLTRCKSDLTTMITGQYFVWSILFWWAFALLLIAQAQRTFPNSRLAPISSLCFVIIIVGANNYLRTQLRKNYYTDNVLGVLDITTQSDNFGNERLLVPDLEVTNGKTSHLRQVKDSLISNQLNIFSDGWGSALNKNIKRYYVNDEYLNVSKTELYMDNDSLLIWSIIEISDFSCDLPTKLLLVKDNIIVGLGRRVEYTPLFASSRILDLELGSASDYFERRRVYVCQPANPSVLKESHRLQLYLYSNNTVSRIN